MPNKRIYFAVQQVSIAPVGTATYLLAHAVHGVQTVGLNTKFNLEQIFEIGQLAIYENVENIPDVEATLEKVIDGYPLMYHLATYGATANTLAGRSNTKAQLCLSIFDDTQQSASGNPITEVECSGVFVSAAGFTLPVQGNCTESITLVGNNKLWRTAAWHSSGRFATNDDTPIGSGGVQRRQHVLFGSGYSVLPPTIPGISGDSQFGTNLITGQKGGWNYADSEGNYSAHIQQIKIDTNLGRESMYELGHKGVYHRYVNFPVEVKTDIEVMSIRGDLVQALENSDNVGEEKIKILLREGTIIDLGTHNVLQSVSYGGANAGNRGGNATMTFSYLTFNDFVVKHPQDPTAFAYP